MAFYVLAKYGEISHMTTFRTEIGDLKRGERVILRSDRGTEAGVIVTPPGGHDQPPPEGIAGEILRRITGEDLRRIEEIAGADKDAEMKHCRERIEFHKLPMKLVDVEHIFGGEKIIFYFLADGRVDFRQLVKDLAKEYRTRIELKQIGVRDEARLLADFDHCGREICCRAFIRDLQPVTMKMAKAQKATLDPSKISGRCGRLMCCLRYEDRVYEELKKKLPRKGAVVITKGGKAEVIDYDIISQTLRVETEEGRIVKVHMKEVLDVIPRDDKEYQRKQQERSQQRAEQAENGGPKTSRSRRGRGRSRGGRSRRQARGRKEPQTDGRTDSRSGDSRKESPDEASGEGQSSGRTGSTPDSRSDTEGPSA